MKLATLPDELGEHWRNSRVAPPCIAERRGIEMLDKGEAVTRYMRFGDRVRMEVTLPDSAAVFGSIDQKVVKAA